MKFLVVLFALAAVATCKPHQPQGGQPQTFQVQVQPSQQQAQPQPQVIRVITQQAPAQAPPQPPPQTFRVELQPQPVAPPPQPAQQQSGSPLFLILPNLGQAKSGASAHSGAW
uniref:CSON000993 protein n=1 Tax=Culicoides sonorensis TaxID=179676 RepID=A0A336LR35_CULSO